MKKCSRCETEKPLSEFYSQARRGKRETVAACKECYVGINRKLKEDGVRRKFDLNDKYGMTPEDYDDMLLEQSNSCAICDTHISQAGGRGKFKLHVDHDHVTGAVRGLLCINCNTALGKFKDSEDLLLAAIQYLRR